MKNCDFANARLGGVDMAGVRLGGAVSLQAETKTYLAGLSESISKEQTDRIDAFVKALKAGLGVSSLADCFDALYLFANETSECALRNLVKDAHHATAVNYPLFTVFRGFAGDGVASYINTNYNPATQAVKYTLNSAAIGLFSNTDIGGTSLDMGARTTSVTNRIVLATRYNDTFLGHINTHSVAAGAASTNSAGCFIATRTAATAQSDYKNGLNVKDEIDAASALPSAQIVIGAMNTAGTISAYSSREYAFAFIGRGLTQAEVSVVQNAITHYLDSFYLTSNILYSGSSTTAAYAGASAISSLITTLGNETDIAAAGSTIANQVAAYNALSSTVKASIDKAFVMIGGNDMQPETTAAAKIAELQNYVNAIKAGSPRCRIFLATLHPSKQRWIDLYGATDGLVSQQKWADYNSAIRKTGTYAITNTYAYFDQHTTDLDDGNGNLKAAYDTGDHIHMTDAGKAFIVTAFKAKANPLPSEFWYGIERDETIASPDWTRVASSLNAMDLHRTLPVQSSLKACLLNADRTVNYYLDENDWSKKEDGTQSDRTGAHGNVMGRKTKKTYWKFEKVGNNQLVKCSVVPNAGFYEIDIWNVGAYEGCLVNGKLASVAGVLPTTSRSETQFRADARANGAGYEQLWNEPNTELMWMQIVEFASFNIQKPVDNSLTVEGYRKGGLGNGVTTAVSAEWNTYNGYSPFIVCGASDSLGNGSGGVAVTINNFGGAGVNRTFTVPRYRGIEHTFGHIWKWVDGVSFNHLADRRECYIFDNPALIADNTATGARYAGNVSNSEGWVKTILFGKRGDIMPASVGGSSTTQFCDYFYAPALGSGWRALIFGGHAYSGSHAGRSAVTNSGASFAYANFGARLFARK